MIKQLAGTSLIVVCTLAFSPAQAIEFEYAGADFTWLNKLTAGAGWRTSARDIGKIGKLNVPGQEYLCSNRGGNLALIAQGFTNDDDCISITGNPAPNQRLVNARGGYFAGLTDDGNLNFDNGDLVSALVKINTQLGIAYEDWTVKLNYVGFYDDTIYNLDVTHQNTQYQPRHERVDDSVRTRAGLKGEFREAFILRNFEIDERVYSIAVGQQRLRWGEANLHLFNTLDAINPLDAILALQPGFNLNELAVPTGMVLFTADIIENVGVEVMYQYDWDITRIQPSGTFFSTIDPGGIASYRPVLSLSQFPEDPNNEFIPGLPFRLLSSSGRAPEVTDNSNPAKDDGQYGIKLNWYAENFNDGTEFGFYFLNYHSRVPYFSMIESEATCLRGPLGLASCAPFNPAALGNINPAGDPLPIDRAQLQLDYPEDIRMFGVSVNTTAFGWSVSGEYSYRPNLPAQVLLTDVFYAGFQQALPKENIGVNLLGQGAILPSAYQFIPSFLASYRGRTKFENNEFLPGEYVPGFERLKVGQFVINGLKLLPSTWGSDDVTVLAEFGFTHVIDMPKEGDIYFQGRLEHTHPSPGADCTGFAAGTNCSSIEVTTRITPTQQTDGFAEDFAAGIRALVQFKYSNVFNSGITLKPTLLWFEDIYGTTIFPVQNYVEGNRWMVGGLQYEIGQAFNGTLLYQYFDGEDNASQDRDNISLSLTYNF